jgi:hypothetical protein
MGRRSILAFRVGHYLHRHMGVQALTDREKLPNRIELPLGRHGVRMPVVYVYPNGTKSLHTVTFNITDEGRVSECFFVHDEMPEAKGGQLCELLEDGCKLLSRLLHYGDSVKVLADYCGANCPEGAKDGPPSSIIGAIARAAVDLEKRAMAHA